MSPKELMMKLQIYMLENNISKKELEIFEKQEILKKHEDLEYDWMWRMKGHEYGDKIK